MADQLCTPQELASALQSDLDASTANLWVNAATAVVQEAAGLQRIVEVLADTAELIGLTDSWLDLPQIPVTDVTSVTLDGTTLTVGVPGSGGTTYRRKGNRLWRGDGWQTYCGEPSDVAVVYDHGYSTGHQRLELGRAAALGLSKQAYANIAGAKQERIDDYAVVYAELSAVMETSTNLRRALRNQYGRRAGLARLG